MTSELAAAVETLTTAPSRRQKRNQVAKACDGCRILRIKCDDHSTCSNCKARGKVCSNSGISKSSPLSKANDEILRLNTRIADLETALRYERANKLSFESTLLQSAPYRTPESARSNDREDRVGLPSWEGLTIRPSRSPNESWFGPSSLYYFMRRLSVALSLGFGNSPEISELIPLSSSSTKLLEARGPDSSYLPEYCGINGEVALDQYTYLSPIKEQYFINSFWETYHTSILPIIDESDFKKHYQSLWTGSGSTRKPSALVDIVVALCMQFNISSLPVNLQGGGGDEEDATISGRRHFGRGQMLLLLEAESPTISTLQCHLLCVAYLCGGSFHNMVDVSNALAVRTAHILGLHTPVAENLPEGERQLRKRLWWAVCLVDSKVGMKLGRPFLIHNVGDIEDIPTDSIAASMNSGSTFAPIGQNATWLSFNFQHTRLYMKVRAAHEAFFTKNNDLESGQTIWNDSRVLNEYADCMSIHGKILEEWTSGIPDPLKIRRRNGVQPFSTEDCELIFEQFAPLWLQRQCVLLELTYHHLNVNLFRQFICFTSIPEPGSKGELAATKCASHAITLSTITHQVLSSTIILNGWHEAFQWQWSAAMALVGYINMYPSQPLTKLSRIALDHAISIFDMFGVSFAVAAHAAKIMRELCAKVDQITAKALESSTTKNLLGPLGQQAFISEEYTFSGFGDGLISYANGLEPGLFDMAVDVEFWADLDTLWPQADSLMVL